MRHQELLRSVWATQVPQRDQAATVQGELLRAVVKLEDEAMTDEDVWERLDEAVGDWCAPHTEPIARELDAGLAI